MIEEHLSQIGALVDQVRDDAIALQRELGVARTERDRARAELDVARGTLEEAAEQIAELRAELERCRDPEPRCRVGRNQEAPELEEALGVPLRAVRVFKRTAAEHGAAPWADVDALLDEGYKVYLSVKDIALVGSVAKVYRGARLVLIMHHEPENDTDPAAWQREQREAAWLAGGVPFAFCLMAATFGEQADRWIPADVGYDEVCVDGYLRGYPWRRDGFAGVFAGAFAWAEQHGLPLAITEVGALSAITPRGKPPVVVPEAEQAAAIDQLHALVAERGYVRAVCWWEGITRKQDATRDYRITGRPVALEAFRRLAADPAVTG